MRLSAATDKHAMKHIAVVALLLVAQAIAGPTSRDLNDDITAAGQALGNFDVETDNYIGVLNAFHDEIRISIRNIYGEIERNLQLIPELTSETVSELTTSMANGVEIGAANVTGGIGVLTSVGYRIIQTNDVLQTNLTQLETETIVLEYLFQYSKGELLVMGMTVPSIYVGIDSQVKTALTGLSGTPVVDILVGLQGVIDILYEQNFFIENANIVYENRGEIAFAQLKVVNDQIP